MRHFSIIHICAILLLFEGWGVLADIEAPVVSSVDPQPGLVEKLDEVTIRFSEPVFGLDALDLLVNGAPAESLSGAGAGPYVFEFPAQSNGGLLLTWREDHGVEDDAPEPNAFQPGEWRYEVDPNVRYTGVEITEMLAGNQNGLMDDDRDHVDWIELHNTTDTKVDLTGWSLSDDPDQPGKWVFDGLLIGPDDYLIVFASSKDRPNRRTGFSPHTNFSLSRAGEFLGLYSPEMPRRLVSDLGDRYPVRLLIFLRRLRDEITRDPR